LISTHAATDKGRALRPALSYDLKRGLPTRQRCRVRPS
jgi:hypothetical protein